MSRNIHRRTLLHLFNEWDHDIFLVQILLPELRNLGQQWNQPGPLILEALRSKVSSAFEVPALASARPIGQTESVGLERLVYLGSERWQGPESSVESLLDAGVVADEPQHGPIVVGVQLIHGNREDVVAVVIRGLFFVERRHVL